MNKRNGEKLQCRGSVIGISLLLALSLVACGGETETKKVGEVEKPENTSPSVEETVPTETQQVEPAKEQQTVFHVGEILQDGKMEIIYMSSGEYVSDNQFLQPAEGNKYIFAQFAFQNISDKNDASVSSFSFECYADGYATDSFYGGDENLSATLSPGRATSGYLYFEVPVDAQEIEIEYTPNVLSSKKITFLYEGEMDSGYEVKANTLATEGACKVGESVSSKFMTITYLSCFEDESDNMFIQPKDGYRYVTCEFEFENTSSSDERISYFSFDCYADGISCEITYFRDDAISATLSAGRKAKGTVTFEVPVDAQVVEVEYLTDYWTSNRVVFAAEVE